MSVKRVYRVAKARKDQRPCSKCGDPIKRGDAYLYWEPYFRSNYKQTRCKKSTCYPRPSELESSKMSSVYAAQEAAQDAIEGGGQESAQDFEELRDTVVGAYDEVISEYRDADEQFGGGGSSQSGERADELEDQKSQVEDVSFDDAPERDELDPCAEHEEQTEGCEACDQILEEAMDEWRTEQADNLTNTFS